MNSNRSGYTFAALALTFVAGGLIGAAFGLLFAPRTGAETRGKIREQTEGAREKVRETAKTAQERADRLTEAGKEKFSEARGKVQKSVGKIREKVSPKKEEEESTEA